MQVTLERPTIGHGHKTVVFDAATETGGQQLEQEVASLVAAGHTVFVNLPGRSDSSPVVAYDHTNKAWITRDGKRSVKHNAPTKATALAPGVGG